MRLRHRHSAVESAINALEVHGLDVCPDHGIDGFKRYAALAVVGRNLHRLGAILSAWVTRLRAVWTRIAIRVAGSWIAAAGMLTLAWVARPVAGA